MRDPRRATEDTARRPHAVSDEVVVDCANELGETPIWDEAHADADRVTIPPGLQAEYGRVPGAMEKVLKDAAARGIPPEQVAEAIERALTAPRMKARYLVGRQARGMLLAKRLLPDLVFDRLARRAMGV